MFWEQFLVNVEKNNTKALRAAVRKCIFSQIDMFIHFLEIVTEATYSYIFMKVNFTYQLLF